jgi:hypothetical protein
MPLEREPTYRPRRTRPIKRKEPSIASVAKTHGSTAPPPPELALGVELPTDGEDVAPLLLEELLLDEELLDELELDELEELELLLDELEELAASLTTASALTTEPPALLMNTVYVPAVEAVILLKVKLELVKPSCVMVSLFHW